MIYFDDVPPWKLQIQKSKIQKIIIFIRQKLGWLFR